MDGNAGPRDDGPVPAPRLPDYDLDDLRLLSTAAELRAIGDPLRSTLADLVLERAASVTELATAVGRPRSTVAHHVSVLVDAGLLRVVRTRRVRAIDERFYGRVARVFYVAPLGGPGDPFAPDFLENYLVTAAAESVPVHQADQLRAILRRARIPRESAAEFWDRVFDLVREFSALPRSGDTVYSFVAGLYPSDQPYLPDAGDTDAGDTDAGGPDAGDTDAGDTDSGGPDAGDTDSGSSDSGGPNAGGTDAGDTDSGGPGAGEPVPRDGGAGC